MNELLEALVTDRKEFSSLDYRVKCFKVDTFQVSFSFFVFGFLVFFLQQKEHSLSDFIR